MEEYSYDESEKASCWYKEVCDKSKCNGFCIRHYKMDVLTHLALMEGKLKYPIIAAAVFGLVFYFFPPGFYVSMKSTSLSDSTNLDAYYEIFRLSSFWSHAYTLAYALTIFLIYYFDYVMQKGWTLINTVLILFLFVVLVFAQMRVCIFSALLSFIFLYFFLLALIRL